ncbi:MAG: tetratricopeptide repeat protein [Mucilaginibacter sp.]
MKYILILLLLFCIGFTASAQQVDNSLLLDYYQTQRFADAAKYLKSVYQEPITDIKALTNLAYTSRMAGNLADAEGYYQRIYDKDSSNVAILFNLGSINMSRGNKVKSLLYYTKILRLDSTNFAVYKQLASLAEQQLDTVGYGKYLIKANTINPQEPDVAFELFRYHIIFKRYKDAENVLDKAIAADTDNVILLKGKAQINYLQKKNAETITSCLRILKTGDKDASVTNWLAISYFRLRQYKLAITTFLTMSADKMNEGTFFYIGTSYEGLADYPNAILYFNKALKDGISSNVPDYYNDIGDSYGYMHQSKKAIAAYQKSLQFEERPLTYYSLANVYDVDLKDKKMALKYYKKYLAGKHDDKEEKKYLDYTNLRIPELSSK